MILYQITLLLFYRRNLQTAMIDNGLIEWLVKVLEDNDSLSDYTLLLFYRRNLQTAMIDNGLIEWLVKVLENNDSLSDYSFIFV